MSRPSHQLQVTLTAIVLAAVLSGCGGTVTTTGSPPEPPPGTGVAISGRALAGAQPLIGATVQLYAAGTTGNGSTPTSLSASAASDASGAFTIPAGYTCPAASSQLYLVARGGSLTPATSGNPAVALITPLGRCDALSATADFIVNEATTAATAWALSQFLAPGGDLGATATNTTGLANAVATALSLTGNTTGVSPGPSFPANGLSPAHPHQHPGQPPQCLYRQRRSRPLSLHLAPCTRRSPRSRPAC